MRYGAGSTLGADCRSKAAPIYTDIYVCPAGKALNSTGTLVNDGATLLYRAGKYDCDACELKPRCCPKMPARKVPRSIYENARDVARGRWLTIQQCSAVSVPAIGLRVNVP
jgi:hypothetical protein